LVHQPFRDSTALLQRDRNPQRKALPQEMYIFFNLDGLHSEAAQQNAGGVPGQGEAVSAKTQIIMMIFALRSFGKCTFCLMQISS